MKTEMFRRMISLALLDMTINHPRAQYAYNVLDGQQQWSGADLSGIAKFYGKHYAYQRATAANTLRRNGGCIVATGRGGFLRSAVYVGMDDYGNAVWQCRDDVRIQQSPCRAYRAGEVAQRRK